MTGRFVSWRTARSDIVASVVDDCVVQNGRRCSTDENTSARVAAEGFIASILDREV